MFNLTLKKLLVCLLISSTMNCIFNFNNDQNLYLMEFRTNKISPYVFKPENFTITRLEFLERIDEFSQFQAGYTFETPGIYFTRVSGAKAEFEPKKNDFFMIVLRPLSVNLGIGMIPLETVSLDEFLSYFSTKYEENTKRVDFMNKIELNQIDQDTTIDLAETTKMIMNNFAIFNKMQKDSSKIFEFNLPQKKEPLPFDPAKVPTSIEGMYINFATFHIFRVVRGIIANGTYFEDDNEGLISVVGGIMDNFSKFVNIQEMIDSVKYAPQLSSKDFVKYFLESIALEDLNLVFDCMFDTHSRGSSEKINFGLPQKMITDAEAPFEQGKPKQFTYKSLYYKLMVNMYNYVFKLKNFPLPNRMNEYSEIFAQPIEIMMGKFPANKKNQETMMRRLVFEVNKFHHGLLIEILFFFEKFKKNINDFISKYIHMTNSSKTSQSSMLKAKTFQNNDTIEGEEIEDYLQYSTFKVKFGLGETTNPEIGEVDILTWTAASENPKGLNTEMRILI